MNLSTSRRNTPPAMNPAAAGSQAGQPRSAAIAIDGASSDQKLAAIITPPAKPSITSRNFCPGVLRAYTTAAPSRHSPGEQSADRCLSDRTEVKKPFHGNIHSPFFYCITGTASLNRSGLPTARSTTDLKMQTFYLALCPASCYAVLYRIYPASKGKQTHSSR